jgi:uncharacterized protein YndB with AHSA1/START domain
MDTASEISIRRSITVDATQARAFDVFVNMTAWWPLDTHTIGEAPARASIVEPHVGGRWYGIDKNGAEHGIGHVLDYDRPDRLVLSWEVSSGWEYDPNIKTEVEIRFIAETPTRTRVELDHRGLEAYGEKAAEMRATYESDNAWTYILGRFAAGANAEAE